MVKLFISLLSKIQLAHQNRFKNYNITPLFNNIYVSPFSLTIASHVFPQHQIITIYTYPAQFQFDQKDFMDLSANNKNPKNLLTVE